MKKFLKWTAIVLGGLLVIAIGVVGYFYFKYKDFGKYPSGGPLSAAQAAYDVTQYVIDVDVFPDDKTIAGEVTIKFRAVESLQKIKLNLVENLTVNTVVFESKQADFKREHDTLWVTLPRTLSAGENTFLIVNYRGAPTVAANPPWMGGFNWSKDAQGNHWIGLSCQGEGAKIWMPCKDHPSDEPDSVLLTVTVPEPYVVAANGLLRGRTTASQGRVRYHWATNYPINNYSINFSIARYETVQRNYVTQSGATMPVVFYVLPQDRDKADRLIDMAVDMLKTYREYFGEYPFAREKFGLVETDYLGMEHQTINAYGNKFRYEKYNDLEWDGLMLHEMGHEWWGNKVTVADWADFWIHEGICVYGEALYQRSKNGEAGYHHHMKKVRESVGNKRPIVPKRNATTTESYYGDIYTKGACLMHSLRYQLGDSAFFRMIYQLSNDSAFTYQSKVSTEDVIALVNRNAGRDLTAYMKSFLYTTTLPEIVVTRSGSDAYTLGLANVDYELPIDVRTDQGTSRVTLTKTPITLASKTEPVVDEMDWYLKTVTRREAQ